VTLRIAVGNRSSERIAEKLGFLREGTLRDDVKIGTRWVDHSVWGLLSNEWKVERERYAAQAWM
jgi:RimJ/RimL family protein N-acetyltransferase